MCDKHSAGMGKRERNTHLHLSVTRGGICERTDLWKPIYFQMKTTEPCWRAAIVSLLGKAYDELDL